MRIMDSCLVLDKPLRVQSLSRSRQGTLPLALLPIGTRLASGMTDSLLPVRSPNTSRRLLSFHFIRTMTGWREAYDVVDKQQAGSDGVSVVHIERADTTDW